MRRVISYQSVDTHLVGQISLVHIDMAKILGQDLTMILDIQ